jgi:FkbM family methyltransferase
MAFARRTRAGGRVLVVEPDPANADEFRRAVRQRNLPHVEVVCAAAWSERASLVIRTDPQHPAATFTDGCTAYKPSELARFQEVRVDAAPLDELIEHAGLDRVDVVSITTNGAEAEILRGLRRTLERHRPYVCLARTAGSYADLMSHLGYELLDEDDRGFTFRNPRRNAADDQALPHRG